MQNVSPSTEKKTYGDAITAAQAASSHRTFLERRGLSFETMQRYAIVESNGSIVIPFVKAGVVKNNKYRSTTEKKFWQDGGTQFAWNMDCLDDETLDGFPVVITEGEIDALTAIQSGFVKTISAPNGGTEGTVNLAWMDEIDDKLSSEIIIATDNDDVGLNLLEAISIFLGRARCKWVKYPLGCKDLNEVLQKHGEDAVKDCLKNAAWMKVDGVYDMQSLPPIPVRKPMSAGMGIIDNHLRLRFGDFSVWTGIPGHGKSTFLNDFTNRIIDKYNLKICFASFEQSPQIDHRRALRIWKSGKYKQSEQELIPIDAWINDRFRFIVPADDDNVTLEWLFERMEATVIRDGVKIIVIDPWNEMDHAKAQGETLTEYTGKAIRQIKAFAKSRAVHMAVVAHPAKMQRDRNGKYPVPTLYDISDSQHWANKADLGVVVHRGGEDIGDTLRIVKSRHHQEIGTPAIIDIKYNYENARFQVVDNNVLNSEF